MIPVPYLGSYVMHFIKAKLGGEAVVTGFCLLVFGVFCMIVVSNLI